MQSVGLEPTTLTLAEAIFTYYSVGDDYHPRRENAQRPSLISRSRLCLFSRVSSLGRPTASEYGDLSAFLNVSLMKLCHVVSDVNVCWEGAEELLTKT